MAYNINAISPYYDQYQQRVLQQMAMQQPMGYQQPMQQPMQQQVPQHVTVRVDGPTEAMNRFLMGIPAVQLVPGFSSDPIFDVNGRQFYVLSVEQDGRRNLETFDYEKHVGQDAVVIDGAQFVSRGEYDKFVAKVNAALGAINGISGPVQAAADAGTSEATHTAAAAHSAAEGAALGRQA